METIITKPKQIISSVPTQISRRRHKITPLVMNNNNPTTSTSAISTRTTITNQHQILNSQKPHSKTLQKLHDHKKEEVVKRARYYDKAIFQSLEKSYEPANRLWLATKEFLIKEQIEQTTRNLIIHFLSMTRHHLRSSSQRIYLSKIRKLHEEDFKDINETYWDRTIKLLQFETTQEQDKGEGHASKPISATEVKNLINNNNIDNNMKKFIFRMWVTTARYDDMQKQVVTKFHPEQQVVEIKQQADKSHSMAFVRIVPCTLEQFYRVWNTPMIIPKQNEFLKFLKEHTKEATGHSFRKGSIQHLQLQFNPTTEISLLSGHTERILAIRYYINTDIHNKDFQIQLRMTTALVKSIYSDGNY